MSFAFELRPTDRLVLVAELFFGLFWLASSWRSATGLGMVGLHVALAGVPVAVAYWSRGGGRIRTAVRQLYPVALIGTHWTEAGLIHSRVHEMAYDTIVMGWDRALFGVNLQAEWMPAMPYVWLSEVMLFLYFTYYPVAFGTPLVLAIRRRHEATVDVVFRLFVTYMACYVIYLFFPVEGPKLSMGRMSGPHEAAFFYRLVERLTEAGDALGTAFPSSHVAGMWALAIAGHRWFRRETTIVLTLLAVGMTVSTVYVQHHFAIDALVGMLLAAVCAVASPALQRVLAARVRPVRESGERIRRD